MIKLGYPFTAALILTSTFFGTMAQAFDNESVKNGTPITPKEFLLNIRSASTNNEIVDEGFFNTVRLKQFLGAGYHFSDYPGSKKGVSFSDSENRYSDDDGQPTWLGLHRPCLRHGTFIFVADGLHHKPQGSITLLTIVRGGGPNSAISAEMVEEVFGIPQEITEGHPTGPPPHGYPYIESPRTNVLGNRWLTYRTESAGMVVYAKFLTVADGTVSEIELDQHAL
jgi:hypothetical protein